MAKRFGRGTWLGNARHVEAEFGGYVDYKEQFYLCPCCEEPIYLCDWSNKDFAEFICPICEDTDLEDEYDEDMD